MCKKTYFRLLSFFMTLILCFSSALTAFAEESAQLSTEILTEQDENVVNYDTKSPITYAEFVKMASKLFHYDKQPKVQSGKITLQAWFAENISTLATEKPDETLTRQDAAVMIAKILKCNLTDDEKTKFKDDAQIEDYAKGCVNALTAKGYLNGYADETFRPQNPITFGEATNLLTTVSGTVYEKAGTYDWNGQTIKGNLSIVSPGIELKNAVVEGDLYISEGVGTGEVTLDHVTVKGQTIVSGGGMNSILFVDTQLGSLRVEVPDNTPVRVVASGSTNINMTEVRSETKLQTDTLTGDGFEGIVIAIPSIARVSLEGNFPSVVVDSPNAKVDILGGKTENIVITEKAVEAKVNLSSTTTVSSMEINAQATIGGTGSLESVFVTSQNVSIAQEPTIVDVADNITTTVNNNIFNTGTHNTNKGSSSSHASGNQQNSGFTGGNGSLTLNGPENVTVYAGEKAVFKVDAKASSKLYYQWYRNDTEIRGAKSDSYSFITALSNNGDKFTVKVWTEGSNHVVKETATKTAVLTVKSNALKPKEKVLLAKGSEGIAGNASITGLEIGQRYYIIQYKDNQSYVVRKDGTLGAVITGEVLYENLESIATDSIIDLVNNQTYKVVKVLEKEKDALDYSYVELSQGVDSIVVDMIFDEPIEFFVNGKNPSTLNNVFAYHSGSLNGVINNVTISDDKKEIQFFIPKKGDSNDYQISLSEKTKEQNWRLKNINADNEYKAMKGIFLSFTVDDLSHPPFTVKGPNDVSVIAGKKAVFQANAEPASGLHYQWYRDDKEISGATSDSYSFTPGLSDNGAKFFVKVWAEKPGRVREPVFSKDAFLTIKSKPNYVILKEGSEGIAGDARITGLEVGQRYYIIQYKDNQSYVVRKDGTLGAVITGEVLYENLESIATDSIIDLVNNQTYKVVKVLEKEKDALDYSYVELSQGVDSIVVDMIFDEPIEFFVNGKNPSTLNNVFVYHSGSLNGIIDDVTISDDKKEIQFFISEKGDSNDYQISLSDKAKEENWRLKNVAADNEYKAMKDIFLSFTVDDLSHPPFTIEGPNDVFVTAGEKVVFQVNVKPASEYHYQWYRDGKAVSGATTDSYSFIPGLSDNGVKFSAKVWTEKPGRVREPADSRTAFLTVKPEDSFVILEEGSEGTAGNACVTGLTEGQCYYIISYKDNKSYAVKADGTLGAAGTTFDYDVLEPLTTKKITGLTNGEKYKVVKVEEPDFTVILEEGSEGTAGNKSVTDLEEGQRYYIISYKDDKSYAVKADGTLGAAGTTFDYDALESLETTIITGLTNLERYKVVKVEEPEEPDLTVILEEGSEGTAGNACVTGLEIGRRYYIISYKDNKSYPVMKDGTLGPETTETIYENIEPLETTMITGLINEEKYNVVKVLPDTPVLQWLNIFGLSNTLDFRGYVPKAIDGQASVSTTQFSLKMESNKEDSTITVSYHLVNGEETTVTPIDDSYRIPLNYTTSAEVTIVVASKEDAENKSVYKLNVTRAADIIVTRSSSGTTNVGAVSLPSPSDIYFYIKYMKPTETFEGIECKKNGTTIAFTKDEHYTETLQDNGTIHIAVTKAFADTIVAGDSLEFTFNFSGGTVKQKVCTVSIRKSTTPTVPSYNIKFGEPELISGSQWLNVFVPVTKDTGEPVDDEIDNIIQNYSSLITYHDNDYYYSDSFYRPTIDEYNGQKGIFMNLSIQITSDSFDRSKKAVPNKYEVSISYKETSGDTFVTKTFTKKKDIPEGEAIQGTVEFYKKSDSSIKLVPTKVSEDEFTLNLTNDNTPFKFEFKNEKETKIFGYGTESGHTTLQDGKDIYTVSEKPELVYIVAHMNSVPKLFLYDYTGEATITDDFVKSQNIYIYGDRDLGYNFSFNYVTAKSNYPTTEEELKAKYLDPENIRLKIGTKKDGTAIEKTMKELLGLNSRNSVRNLYFDSVKELIAAFGINPVKDTINSRVVSSAQLSGNFSKFKLSDSSYSFYSNTGALTEIIIKDKNSDASIKINPSEKDIVVPYKDAAILTKSTANYECVIYDEDAVPVDGKGLILSEGVSTPIAIVVSTAGVCPKIYPFTITYEPQDDTPTVTEPAKAKMRMFASRPQEVCIPFIQLTDDMTEEEIAEILKSLENESVSSESSDKVSSESSTPGKPSEEVPSESPAPSEPSDEDTSKPSDKDTNKPSGEDANKPSDEDTNKPSDEDTNKPSDEDTNKPSDEDTNKPSDEDTNKPSDEDTNKPSDEDTNKPSDEDTNKPSDEDTNKPSDEDTNKPSDEDTNKPSDEDANEPSDEDTSEPSDEDMSEPSDEDTSEPSDEDTSEPSDEDTSEPSDEDTSEPSDEDTSEPSDEDTSEPSDEDTSEPSDEDTSEPSDEDTSE